MAATRLIALHKNKGKSVAACLKSRTDYVQNPDKTEQGELVSSYECSPLTVDEEFMLSKRQYELATGRRQKSDVIAYQIRQSFKPGEITAEEANKVGYELAMRFTKGKYLHGLQRQRSQGRSVDEVLKHILSAKGHLQAADVPCYILKITIYRSDDTMVDKFSQVAGNVPVTNNDPNRRYTVINGYPVVLNFAKEPNPGVFERVRDILLATSYTKKTS